MIGWYEMQGMWIAAIAPKHLPYTDYRKKVLAKRAD